MQKQVHIKIHGKVQGVFFRAETRKKALELGLTGWVKNTEDDGVEVLVRGEERELTEFIAWCKKGPPRAEVSRIEILQQEAQGNFNDFSII